LKYRLPTQPKLYASYLLSQHGKIGTDVKTILHEMTDIVPKPPSEPPMVPEKSENSSLELPQIPNGVRARTPSGSSTPSRRPAGKQDVNERSHTQDGDAEVPQLQDEDQANGSSNPIKRPTNRKRVSERIPSRSRDSEGQQALGEDQRNCSLNPIKRPIDRKSISDRSLPENRDSEVPQVPSKEQGDSSQNPIKRPANRKSAGERTRSQNQDPEIPQVPGNVQCQGPSGLSPARRPANTKSDSETPESQNSNTEVPRVPNNTQDHGTSGLNPIRRPANRNSDGERPQSQNNNPAVPQVPNNIQDQGTHGLHPIRRPASRKIAIERPSSQNSIAEVRQVPNNIQDQRLNGLNPIRRPARRRIARERLQPQYNILEVTQFPHGVQRQGPSGSFNPQRRFAAQRGFRERPQSQSCAPESEELSRGKFRDKVATVISRKSAMLPRDNGQMTGSFAHEVVSSKATTDSTEELGLLASHLGRLLQENDDLDFFAEKRMLGSCEWLLDEPAVSDFLQEPKHSHILWCTGRPGSGKSVFASSVITFLRDNDAKCAFHFFRFGNEAHNSLSSFLVSIAYQIAERIPLYRVRLIKMFDQGLCLQKCAPRLIWQKLFSSTLFKMDIAEPLYLVVDGLDECDSSVLLLKLLGDISSSKPKFCVMLVSRKTQLLSTGLDKLSKAITIEPFSLEDVDEDLRMYVDDEMQAMRGDQSFKDRIAERILAKADGNFLWTNLVLKEVLQCHTETEIEDALNDVPEDLEHLYERMDAALARNSRPTDQAMARTILMWVVCSRHPLNLEQLGDALTPEYAEVLDLRLTINQVCGELIVIDTKGIVSMVHATARDFLAENRELNFHISAADSHQKIFTKCLTELIAASSRIQMGQIKPKSFLLYAATSWAYHLNLTSTCLDQESLLLLAQFFRGPAVLSWIHLLSYSSQLGTLVQTSKIIATFLKQVDRLDSDRSPLTHRLLEKDMLSLWTIDLVRLVGKFGLHLKSQPKSIYKLVPAFCPPASAIHKTFCSKASQSSIAISGISNPSWDDCLAKFAVANRCLPIAVTSVNKHFAILTSDGTVHLYNSSTLEEGRRFKHGERVLAWCFNQAGDKLVTYGFVKTLVWNVTSGLQLFSFLNPGTAKAITIAFSGSDDSIVTCSDDRNVRCVSLDATEAGWQVLDNVFGSDVLDGDQHNSPRCAAFNAVGSQLAVGYRGFALSVWSVDEPRPCLVGRCERLGSTGQLASGTFVDTQAICWNTVTGHVLGVYNDGCVFKWHPFDGDYLESRASGSDVKCSPDGKFFVTSSADGTLRVWDFLHFSPIYQLSCSSSVTDLAIDPVERRIYDIRESFCNIWEPNSLLRLWETDDKASDTASTRESSTQVSVYSEASGESVQPLTALAVDKNTLNYSVGDDEGVVTFFTRDGAIISEQPQTFMTVEHICWSDNGACVASSDLSRRVTVKSVDPMKVDAAPKPLLTVKEEDPIKQLLLSPMGEYLLVSTDSCLTIWSLAKKEVISSRPQTARYYWTNSPTDPDQLIGFGYSELQISMWEGLGTTWQLDIDRSTVDGLARKHGVHAMFPKPTTKFSTSEGGESEHAVDKVLFTLDGSVALLETSDCSAAHHFREKQFMLVAIDAESIIDALGSKTMVIQPTLLPSELVSRLGLPLGFVLNDSSPAARRKSFVASTSVVSTPADPTRKSLFNLSTPSWRSSSSSSTTSTFLHPPDPTPTPASGTEHTLAFLDHEYWVCTFVLAEGGRPNRVRRHHFLPRDWINMDWLELAVMRPDGTLLCPRNGEVVLVRNGLREECAD
jgi:WD40 repeat protein